MNDDTHRVAPRGGPYGAEAQASRSEGSDEEKSGPEGRQEKGRAEGGAEKERPEGGEAPGTEKRRHDEHWAPADSIGEDARPAKKLSEYLVTFFRYSEKASDALRAAAFAGIGLVWVFKLDTKPVATLPIDLVRPAIWFSLAVALDAAQYVFGTLIWNAFHWVHEKRAGGADPELTHNPLLPAPIWACFLLKLFATGYGYFLVIRYLFSAWNLGWLDLFR